LMALSTSYSWTCTQTFSQSPCSVLIMEKKQSMLSLSSFSFRKQAVFDCSYVAIVINVGMAVGFSETLSYNRKMKANFVYDFAQLFIGF
jgi:hypothetical protein